MCDCGRRGGGGVWTWGLSLSCVVEFLTPYFNKLFDTGTFPLGWCEAIIQPIHKKGDISYPDNYRGISLLNISGKLYSCILNKRLTTWLGMGIIN